MNRPGRARHPWRAPLALLALLLGVALLAPWLTAPDALEVNVARQELPPSVVHPLGTDSYGRDGVALILRGLLVSLAVGGSSMLLAVVVGTTYGVTAAWLGGAAERGMLRLLDVLLATPRVLVLLAVVAFRGDTSLAGLAVVLGLTGWFDLARLVRADVATLRTRDWILAARAAGVPLPRLVVRHLVPHLLPTLGVAGALGVAAAVALEAGLSYLGIGVQAPAVTLGTLLSDGGGLLFTRWWMTVFPGVAIAALVFAFTALGDALRTPARHGQVAA